MRTFRDAGIYGYPHSFLYLSNGDTLVTLQYSGGLNHAPGGLAEFNGAGRIVRSRSAANPQIDRIIRPYSLAVSEALDRVVSGSVDMTGAQDSHVAQIWRLSDMKLLHKIASPARSTLCAALRPSGRASALTRLRARPSSGCRRR